MTLKFDFQQNEVSFFFFLSHLSALSCIAGVDQFGDILPFHKAFQVLEGVLLVLHQHIAEGLRQDGQVIIPPFLVAGVIARRVHRGHQMAHTSGNDEPVPLKTAVDPGCDTQGRYNTLCYTRFFSYN